MQDLTPNMPAIALVSLLALGAQAVVTAVSEPAAVDTRSHSTAVAADAGSLDSHSQSIGWSACGKLDTRKSQGSLMLLR